MNRPFCTHYAAGSAAQASAEPSPDWPRACGVVIPCLDEGAVIGSLVRAVRVLLPTVVVVDDGSSDDTAAVAAAAGAIVLRHAVPQGKGAAVRAGLRWLNERHYPWGLLMDGDGQHAPEDIPALLAQATANGASLVIGNRMAAAARMPWLRRLANRWMSRRLSRLAGRHLPDSQCGFRLLRLPVWAALDLQTAHFEFESELLLAVVAAGEPVDFVPVRVIYGQERTKIRVWRDGWRWAVWWRRAQRCGERPELKD